MEPSEAIRQLLPAFGQYYTLKNEDVTPPFCAEAEFRSHNEQYFLVRAAHIADIDSNEFVYFAEAENLSQEKLQNFVTSAWEEGLKKVHPYNGHRNSDVSLLIFTKSLSMSSSGSTRKSEIIKTIKKTKLYKSYKFSFHGWSHFKLAVCNTTDMEVYTNRQGKDFAKLIKKNIKNPL